MVSHNAPLRNRPVADRRSADSRLIHGIDTILSFRQISCFAAIAAMIRPVQGVPGKMPFGGPKMIRIPARELDRPEWQVTGQEPIMMALPGEVRKPCER